MRLDLVRFVVGVDVVADKLAPAQSRSQGAIEADVFGFCAS